MPNKRKAADQEPPNGRPAAPRRASRRLKDAAETKEASFLTTKQGPSTPDEIKERWSSKEGIERTRREMGEMEEKLAKAARRQRIAVENSDLTIDEPDSTPFQPNPIWHSRSTVNKKSKTEPDEIEKAPQSDYEAELAQGDLAEAKQGDEGAERGAARPPPVNSDILPLPWKGRLGYACLNTYLRNANPPVFSSRTCRISSILDHRHPLQDPSQPEHPTKNRPDKDQPADVERGMKFVQELGLANARDIVKMIRWNDKYGIKFMRLSSEMFPFASHDEYGYKLSSFAAEALAEAGKVAAELGHRLTTHPGQFTQIASPRKEVVTAAIRDLEYHHELLSLLKLPEQMDRDAIMILHMGGVYGDKAATLDRFRENYVKLSEGVKQRLVLENDDVAWSVHDLLPICEELNIPLVLDYHHHNIIFDPSIREGTKDIIDFYDRIRKTWERKRITQKMHYSEPTCSAVTPRDRRKHSARVRTLPPCATDMDLMIEAKDKEQAVFELMRTFKLPGFERFNNIIPYERDDESKKAVRKPKKAKKSKNGAAPDVEDDIETPEKVVSAEDFAMGGPENRVYWPEGMEEWLRPRKRVVTKKTDDKKTVKLLEEE